MNDISIADPIIMELGNSRILRIFKPIKAPGIKIRKRTALAAPIESPSEPLSKNGVKNSESERITQILSLMRILRFSRVLSTSQL